MVTRASSAVPVFRPAVSSRLKIASRFGFVGAVLLALAVRLPFVLGTDFPLNDGGMFYAMVRDLQQAHYALPVFTSYNSAGIPFSYPPLSFYLAGLIADLGHLSLIDVFRFLPLVINLLSVVALYSLARTVLGSRISATFAAGAFALLPRSFEWLIMGGGLTRSLGFLLALLAVRQAYLMYRQGDRKHVILAAILGGCTILSHLEMAMFVVYSIVILFLFYGRSIAGLKKSLVVAVGAAVISSPWWITIYLRHGLAPLLSASDQGWPLFVGVTSLLFLSISSEPMFPLFGCLALLGSLACIAKKWFLPIVWLVPIYALDPRSAPTMATVPLALLAGIGVKEVILPLFNRSHRRNWSWSRPRASIGAFLGSRRRQFWPVYVMLAFFALYGVNAAIVAEQPLLIALPTEQRQAMQWVDNDTPRSSTFLVITGNTWALDNISEWFPVLANRASVATAQGQEWTGAFQRHLTNYAWAQSCASGDADCLDNWGKQTGGSFTHVYVAKKPGVGTDDVCGALRQSLRDESEYQLVYDGPGATIFRHDSAVSQLPQITTGPEQAQ